VTATIVAPTLASDQHNYHKADNKGFTSGFGISVNQHTSNRIITHPGGVGHGTGG
jgi:hypothetical protein